MIELSGSKGLGWPNPNNWMRRQSSGVAVLRGEDFVYGYSLQIKLN